MTTSSPGFSGRHQRVVEHLLAAGADRDLRRRVGEVVLTRELVDDRRLQLRDAVDGGVLRLPVADRLDRGFFDVFGRVEVRLAGAEADHVPTGAFQLGGLLRHRDGGRRFDARERVGQEGHGIVRRSVTRPLSADTRAPARALEHDTFHRDCSLALVTYGDGCNTGGRGAMAGEDRREKDGG